MLITQDDILVMSNSLDDLYKKEIINPNCFGSLIIKCSGSVYSASSYIGKITDNWMQSYTKWIYNDKNPWFYVRKNKKECEGCYLHALCPPISIYEQLSLIPCMCKRCNH